MSDREAFLKALDSAPKWPVTDEYDIPGIPGGIPRLLELQEQARKRMGPKVMAQIRASVADMLAGGDGMPPDDGPWHD